MAACTPRRRYADRDAAAREAAQAAEAARWKDPYTELERWFARLPNLALEEECDCGSGKPVLYWSREDGTGCGECAGPLHGFLYIPSAVMYNVMEKFGITGELRARIYEQIEQSRGRGQQ